MPPKLGGASKGLYHVLIKHAAELELCDTSRYSLAGRRQSALQHRHRPCDLPQC